VTLPLRFLHGEQQGIATGVDVIAHRSFVMDSCAAAEFLEPSANVTEDDDHDHLA
jgi:hypothetical protein